MRILKKTLLTFLIIFVIFISLFMIRNVKATTVLSEGWEESFPPVGWTVYGNCYRSSTVAHSGTYSLFINTTTNNQLGYITSLANVGSGQYQISEYVWVNGSTGATFNNVLLFETQDGSVALGITNSFGVFCVASATANLFVIPSANWEQVTVWNYKNITNNLGIWLNGVYETTITTITNTNPTAIYLGDTSSSGTLGNGVIYLDDLTVTVPTIQLSSYGETSTLANQTSTLYTVWNNPFNQPQNYFQFGTNNSGVWNTYIQGLNSSVVGITFYYGTINNWPNVSISIVNVTMTLYHDIGSTVSYWVWINDTLGNSQNSTILSFTLTTVSVPISNPSPVSISPMDIPKHLAILLGINVFTAGLFCGFILELMFVLPVVIFTDNSLVLTIFAILGLVTGVVLTWLPYVSLILIILIIVLIFADKIRKSFSGGEK